MIQRAVTWLFYEKTWGQSNRWLHFWTWGPPGKVADRIRNFRNGVRNLARWFWVVWEDDDGDWAFLVRLMAVKLKHMESGWAEDSMHVKAEDDERQIREARILCERLWRDRYHEFVPLAAYVRTQRTPEDRDVERLTVILRKHLLKWWI